MPALRHHETEPVLDDQHAGLGAQHFARFAQHQFDQPRILVDDAREFERAGRWRYLCEAHLAAFRFRHDFLRDHHDVAGFECFARAQNRCSQQFRELRAAHDFRDSRQRNEYQFPHRRAPLTQSGGTPVIRMPAPATLVALVDRDQHRSQRFGRGRVHKRASVPRFQSRVAREPDHDFARRCIVAAYQHVAFDLVGNIHQMRRRNILERRHYFHAVAEPALQRDHRRSAFGQLHAVDFRAA